MTKTFTMLKLFKEKEEIKVVSDQWGSPTYTVDLTEVILKMIDVETKEYSTPAQRPKWSLLSKEKIKRELNLEIRNWEDALTDFLSFLSLQIK